MTLVMRRWCAFIGVDESKVSKTLFRSDPVNPVNKKTSHQIFGHMNGVLNEVYL